MITTMEGFICRNCGNKEVRDTKGNVVASPKSIAVNCQYFCTECGEELPQDQLKELISLAVSTSLMENNLRLQARNAKKREAYEEASALYQQLLQVKPDDWEAAFYSVLCNCYNAVGAIDTACNAVEMSLEGVFDKIDGLSGQEKVNAVKLMVSDAGMFALHMHDRAVQQHASLDVSAMTKNNNALRNQLTSALNIMITCASNVMKRYGDDDRVAAQVEIPATVAIQMQSRQTYVTLFVDSATNKTLLEWIGKYNPQFVEEYKKKQNRSMRNGTIFLIIVGAIFFAIGYFTEGFWADFGTWMAVFCGAWAIIRIIIQLTKKK